MSGNLTFIYDCKTVAMDISNTSYKRQNVFEFDNSMVVHVYSRHS